MPYFTRNSYLKFHKNTVIKNMLTRIQTEAELSRWRHIDDNGKKMQKL